MSSKAEKNPKALPLPLSPEAIALSPKLQSTEVKPNETEKVKETGGPKGADPTRFGDWERKGRCSDF